MSYMWGNKRYVHEGIRPIKRLLFFWYKKHTSKKDLTNAWIYDKKDVISLDSRELWGVR